MQVEQRVVQTRRRTERIQLRKNIGLRRFRNIIDINHHAVRLSASASRELHLRPQSHYLRDHVTLVLSELRYLLLCHLSSSILSQYSLLWLSISSSKASANPHIKSASIATDASATANLTIILFIHNKKIKIIAYENTLSFRQVMSILCMYILN